METEKFIFFWGGIYSQWYPCSVNIDGVEYNCTEQYMMAKKALMFHDYETLALIMNSNDPKEQKKLGRQVKGFDLEHWNRYCRKIVRDGNIAKFWQNLDLCRELLATGGKEIVEASPEDKIWGIGMHSSHPDILDRTKWMGTNWLGIAIMEARTEIKRRWYNWYYIKK